MFREVVTPAGEWWQEGNQLGREEVRTRLTPGQFHLALTLPAERQAALSSNKMDFFLKDFIYSGERESRDTGRRRSGLQAGCPMWDSIPGLQDHALGPRQVLNC